MPEWRTRIKLTPWCAFLGWTHFFCLAIGLDAARDGRAPFDAGVFCGAAFLGVLVTIIFWAAEVWKARSRAWRRRVVGHKPTPAAGLARDAGRLMPRTCEGGRT